MQDSTKVGKLSLKQGLGGEINWPILSFGGGAISGEGGGYGFGAISTSEAEKLLLHAYSCGIHVFDTAPIYGFGVSEKRIGATFLKKRDEIFIVSKSGVTWSDSKRVNMTNDPKVTLKMFEQSLRDLQTDYIDGYLIHWPDLKIDIRKPYEVLLKAKEQGKIRYIGLCNTHSDDLEKAASLYPPEILQGSFSLMNPSSSSEMITWAREKASAFMAYGVLEKGILTGRVDAKRRFDKHDARGSAPWWKSIDHQPMYEVVEEIKLLLKNYSELDLRDIAIHAALKENAITTLVCGAKTPDQIDSLIISLQKKVPKQLLNDAELISDKILNKEKNNS